MKRARRILAGGGRQTAWQEQGQHNGKDGSVPGTAGAVEGLPATPLAGLGLFHSRAGHPRRVDQARDKPCRGRHVPSLLVPVSGLCCFTPSCVWDKGYECLMLLV